jgi:signal transduction histidine kinase
MRTPLNCVLIGLELTISQMKGKKISRQSPLSLSPLLPSKNGSDSSLLSPGALVQISPPKDESYLLEILENTFISCQTAIELLNDSLSYDKLEAEEMKLNVSQVPLRVLIERCVTPFLVQVCPFFPPPPPFPLR